MKIPLYYLGKEFEDLYLFFGDSLINTKHGLAIPFTLYNERTNTASDELYLRKESFEAVFDKQLMEKLLKIKVKKYLSTK